MNRGGGDLSDGSDIEIDEEDIEANLIGENLNNYGANVNVNDDEWLQFFDDDHDELLDEEFEGFHEDWCFENFNARIPNRFNRNAGPAEQHPAEARACHYFDMLWGRQFWDLIVEETNRYADQQRTQNPPPPYAPKWQPVDVPTMKAFLGLTFVMGILRLPSRNDYWRTSKRMFVTAFNSVMPRDRFNLIWRYLHLNNSEAPAPVERPDKLRKVRPMIDYLNGTFSRMYTPYGNVTVDETMVKFKGRLGFRQYMPAKPVKWGLKIWSLAESTTGYLHKFQVYTGKENGQEKGLTYRVVTDLLSHLRFTNIRVFMDNFYTSVDLLTSLLRNGIYAAGTLRANRKGLPTQLLPKNIRLEKHQYRVAQKDDLTFTIWQDTKAVLCLSNFHDPEVEGSVNRRTGNPVQRAVRVPKMIEDYQLNMKGVDLCDQMVGYYMPNHRSRKWWRRLFHHLQMVAAYNAYVIAKDSNPEVARQEWPQFQDFVEDLADSLIGDYKPARAAPLPNMNIQNPAPLSPARHIIKSEHYEKKKSCRECRLKAEPGTRVTATRQGCQRCNVSVCQKCVGDHIQRGFQ